MKNVSIKIFSVLTIFTLLFFTSCKENEVKEVEMEETTKEVEVEKTLKITTPQPSPASKLEQVVGLTDVTVEYSRPSMRGRTIFGDLVPYGETWRTGANSNTKVTFSTDVSVNGKNVEAGTYAIYSVPNKNSWEIMLYSASDNWGNPAEWDASKVAATITTDVIKMPMDVETFTITLDDLTNTNGVIGFLWEDVYVGMPFTVPTDKAVMASIDEVMKGQPTARSYYDAAVYLKSEDKDTDKALMYIDKAVEMSKEDPKFWMLRQQSLIHAKAGKTESAIAAAKQSLALAEKANNAGYIKMNKASLKEWGAM